MPCFGRAFLSPPIFPFFPLRKSHVTPRRPPSRTQTHLHPRLCARKVDPIASNPLGPPLIICVGETLFDLLTPSASALITDPTAWTPYRGGSPANLATGLARLGTASAFVGRVGDDDGGEEIRAALEAEMVNVDGVQTVVGAKTRRVFVRRSANGESSFVGFNGRNDEFADAVGFDMETLPGVLLYAAQILVTGTLSLAFEKSAATLVELGNVAKMCKLTVLVDVNWRDVFWEGWSEDDARQRILEYLRERPGADLVKVNVEEVSFLFGEELGARALKEPEAVLKKIGGVCRGVIVTGGGDGASYAFNIGREKVEGFVDAVVMKEGVVDTTGAGDAFLAGFLSEMIRIGGGITLMDPEKVRQMAAFGSTVAGFVIRGEGAIKPLPRREEVDGVMASG